MKVTECHLPLPVLADLHGTAHSLLPLHATFANKLSQSTRKALQISVIMFINVQLVHSLVLDVRPQLDAVGSAVPDACNCVRFVRVLDPHSKVSLLVGNVYQAQAS